MNLGDLRSLYRTMAHDIHEPYFWSDDEIDQYINDALFEAVDRGLPIFDRDTYQVEIEIGVQQYPLDSQIMRVKQAFLTVKDGVTLDRPELFRMSDRKSDYAYQQYFDLQGYHVEEDGMFILATPPTWTATVALEVYRYAKPLAADIDEPEIADRYQRKMLNWALHLGYLKQDADSFNQAKADTYEIEFARTFGQPKTVQQHRQRRRNSARSLKTPSF